MLPKQGIGPSPRFPDLKGTVRSGDRTRGFASLGGAGRRTNPSRVTRHRTTNTGRTYSVLSQWSLDVRDQFLGLRASAVVGAGDVASCIHVLGVGSPAVLRAPHL